MPKIYMVRHGRAAAGWDADKDPGLDETGHAQAEEVARELERLAGAQLPILSSPLRRCRETAAPLAQLWRAEPAIEPAVAEIPSPIDDLEARTTWLRTAMAGTWSELVSTPGRQADRDIDFLAWRRGVIDALLNQPRDTVVFSHFIAINVAVGHALGDDRVVAFRPDNASVTVFETRGGDLILHEKGREADTRVN